MAVISYETLLFYRPWSLIFTLLVHADPLLTLVPALVRARVYIEANVDHRICYLYSLFTLLLPEGGGVQLKPIFCSLLFILSREIHHLIYIVSKQLRPYLKWSFRLLLKSPVRSRATEQERPNLRTGKWPSVTLFGCLLLPSSEYSPDPLPANAPSAESHGYVIWDATTCAGVLRVAFGLQHLAAIALQAGTRSRDLRVVQEVPGHGAEGLRWRADAQPRIAHSGPLQQFTKRTASSVGVRSIHRHKSFR